MTGATREEDTRLYTTKVDMLIEFNLLQHKLFEALAMLRRLCCTPQMKHILITITSLRQNAASTPPT